MRHLSAYHVLRARGLVPSGPAVRTRPTDYTEPSRRALAYSADIPRGPGWPRSPPTAAAVPSLPVGPLRTNPSLSPSSYCLGRKENPTPSGPARDSGSGHATQAETGRSVKEGDVARLVSLDGALVRHAVRFGAIISSWPVLIGHWPYLSRGTFCAPVPWRPRSASPHFQSPDSLNGSDGTK